MPPPIWKPLPQKVDRLHRRQQKGREDERAKTKVRKRDRYHCRVCGRGTKVVHEHPPRSRGTRPSLQSSFCACDVLDGGLCHPLLQRHQITPVMVNGSEVFDANEHLAFEMTEKIAAIAFEDRPRPTHIRIVEA